MKKITNKKYSNKAFYVKEHLAYKPGDLNEMKIKKLEDGKDVLSLGCGAGREVRLLVKKEMRVTAIDFSAAMINSSIKMEPNAVYILGDVMDFLKGDDSVKYDYILGLYGFMCGISREERKLFIEKCYLRLRKNGAIILRIKWLKYTPKYLLRSIATATYQQIVKKKWALGDLIFRADAGEFTISHFFTKEQMKELLKGKLYEIDGEIIRIWKR